MRRRYLGHLWMIVRSQSRRPRLLQIGSASRDLSHVLNSVEVEEWRARTSRVVPKEVTKGV